MEVYSGSNKFRRMVEKGMLHLNVDVAMALYINRETGEALYEQGRRLPTSRSRVLLRTFTIADKVEINFPQLGEGIFQAGDTIGILGFERSGNPTGLEIVRNNLSDHDPNKILYTTFRSLGQKIKPRTLAGFKCKPDELDEPEVIAVKDVKEIPKTVKKTKKKKAKKS